MSERTSFVRLFVGFLLSAAGVHASCPIELSPPSVVVKYGDPVSINCSTSETLLEGMGWEATNGGTGLKKVNHLSWTVASLTDWTFSPLCFFNPSRDSPFGQCSMSPQVVLYTFPETISIRFSGGSGGVVTEMEKFNLSCDINNIAPIQNLTVRWYKGDTIVYTDTFDNPSKEPVNHSSVFSYTPTRQDNRGTFRCEAHLDLGPEEPQLNVSSQEYIITVYFGPDVQCSSPEFLEGETLEKVCPVTGNPTPLVTWLKDGQPTDPAVPLSRENAGLYTVEAEGLSFVQKKLQVLALYGPKLMCPSTYTALEYSPHNLTCIVEGYPKPETSWYKDGEEVELPENLTRSDMGQYLITASNSLTTVNHTVEITVIYPPSQIVELEDSEVDVGSTMGLKCSSTGNPRPKYVWNYYRTANVMEENEDGVSCLLIHNATAYNMGSYTCHAWNVSFMEHNVFVR
ncbi:roundabout homolog 1-like [Enoplosus armatus]|uniref:roundabout homolog 1-like n=1 Tax=Enoplosus armatus TaxID=215367 RepID=UPI003991ED03